MNSTDLACYTDRQNRTLQRVLDDLDRCDERLALHYGRLRDHERRSYRALIWIVVPPNSTTEDDQPPVASPAWARNISCGGLSFVHLEQLRETKLLVCLNPTDAARNWQHAEIVRSRRTQDEFWEYGVRFQGRAQ
jgi:hypothetical protein